MLEVWMCLCLFFCFFDDVVCCFDHSAAEQLHEPKTVTHDIGQVEVQKLFADWMSSQLSRVQNSRVKV